MNITKDDLIAVLSQFNPWWDRGEISDLPSWRRAIFEELFEWIYQPPVGRAILLSGARQTGKTTLQFQVIEQLLKNGVPASNILYATFDHSLIKLAGIEAVISAWRVREPKIAGAEYLFLDEAQFISDWGTWIKHQVDFNKDRRITFTGSAMPLIHKHQESGVGRWHTLELPTLSFYEYLQLKTVSPYEFPRSDKENIPHKTLELKDARSQARYFDAIRDLLTPRALFPELNSVYPIPELNALCEIFAWSQKKIKETSEAAKHYIAYFHEYLVQGGFPQLVKISNISQAQKLLREDIVDKVLKRDMTALFRVRNVLELERTFLYLCLHGGGLLDMTKLSDNLGVVRQTATHFIELLKASHLIYHLEPYGYGKEILRGKYKIYLADAAIAPAVLLKGKAMLDNSTDLGIAIETAVFKHLFPLTINQNVRLTYWKGKKNHEVDLVAESNNQIFPFEIKYRSQHTSLKDLRGLYELCQKKNIQYACVVTKSLDDFGVSNFSDLKTQVLRIPAVLLCYWFGRAEYKKEKKILSFDTTLHI